LQKAQFEQMEGCPVNGKLAYSRRHGWHLVFGRKDLSELCGKSSQRATAGLDTLRPVKRHCKSARLIVLFELMDMVCSSHRAQFEQKLWCLSFLHSRVSEHTDRHSCTDVSGVSLPSGCWELGSSKTQVLCMTNDLASWNLQLDEAAKECQVLTMQMLSGLEEQLAQRRMYVCMLLDALTLLDLLSGFVAYMTDRKSSAAFCRPVISSQKGARLQPLVACTLYDLLRSNACQYFTQCKQCMQLMVLRFAGLLAIERGYHPVHGCIDAITKQKIAMKPNSVELTTFCSMNVLFGANSSGKSTLMKQTGLLCVMAQAGLWVPAASMCLHPFAHICTRMSVQNSTRSNSSTLMVEARVRTCLARWQLPVMFAETCPGARRRKLDMNAFLAERQLTFDKGHSEGLTSFC
jgi:MutS domain V